MTKEDFEVFLKDEVEQDAFDDDDDGEAANIGGTFVESDEGRERVIPDAEELRMNSLKEDEVAKTHQNLLLKDLANLMLKDSGKVGKCVRIYSRLMELLAFISPKRYQILGNQISRRFNWKSRSAATHLVDDLIPQNLLPPIADTLAPNFGFISIANFLFSSDKVFVKLLKLVELDVPLEQFRANVGELSTGIDMKDYKGQGVYGFCWGDEGSYGGMSTEIEARYPSHIRADEIVVETLRVKPEATDEEIIEALTDAKKAGGARYVNSNFIETIAKSRTLLRDTPASMIYCAEKTVMAQCLYYVEHIMLFILRAVSEGKNVNEFDGFGCYAKVSVAHIDEIYVEAARLLATGKFKLTKLNIVSSTGVVNEGDPDLYQLIKNNLNSILTLTSISLLFFGRMRPYYMRKLFREKKLITEIHYRTRLPLWFREDRQLIQEGRAITAAEKKSLPLHLQPVPQPSKKKNRVKLATSTVAPYDFSKATSSTSSISTSSNVIEASSSASERNARLGSISVDLGDDKEMFPLLEGEEKEEENQVEKEASQGKESGTIRIPGNNSKRKRGGGGRFNPSARSDSSKKI